MSEHTKGPWEIAEQNGTHPLEGLVGIVGPEHTTSAGKKIRYYVAQYVLQENARLIALSPEMLEFIKEIKSSILADAAANGSMYATELYYKAEDLIRKATGDE